MHTLFYTVVVKENFLWLTRGTKEWRIGKFTLAGKLRLFSKKVDLFLDADDISMLEKVKVSEKDMIAVAGRDENERENVENVPSKKVGTVEILFAPLEGGTIISIRAGGSGNFENWTEFATWSLPKGIRFDKCAHPVFRKDKAGLSAAAGEFLDGAGVFRAAKPEDSSIFAWDGNTKL